MNLSPARRKYVFLALSIPLLALAAPVKFDISVVRRKAEGGVRTVRVPRGETVTLDTRSDEAFTLHIHGYDVETRVAAGLLSSVQFEAEIVGRFPISAHWPPASSGGKAGETTLLYLEVHPK